MPLLIVAPLEATRIDLGRIEAIRRRHDPHHAVIGAHVTLVFPFDAPDAGTAADHLAEIARSQGAIALRLSAFLAVRDANKGQSHVFLVPDHGRAEVEALHDALYSGPLEGELRPDIPYIPHVTVAAREHHEEAEDLIRELGQAGIAARLPALELIAFDGVTVSRLRRFDLLG
jgi:2'-5' RNA ligase